MNKWLLVFFTMPAFALAAPVKLKPEGGSVEALAVGKPTFIKIRGKGAPATGELQVDGKKAKGNFEFKVATLDTGIELRNEHMRDKYLQVKEHPNAKLEIVNLELKEEWKAANPKLSETPFDGQLTLHGVTKPVKGKFTVGAQKDVRAGFKIKLSDFNIEIPKYLGVTVADEVEVDVNIASLKEVK